MIEILKAILPVLTFSLGIAYGYYDKVKESRRSTANIRRILLKEITSNYQQLNKYWPADGEVALLAPYAAVLAHLYSQVLQTEVFREYLGRLDSLKREELDQIFEAYQFVNVVIDNARRYTALSQENGEARDDKMLASTGVATLVYAESALEKLENALRVLPGGEEEYDRLKLERGIEFRKLQEASDAFRDL